MQNDWHLFCWWKLLNLHCDTLFCTWCNPPAYKGMCHHCWFVTMGLGIAFISKYSCSSSKGCLAYTKRIEHPCCSQTWKSETKTKTSHYKTKTFAFCEAAVPMSCCNALLKSKDLNSSRMNDEHENFTEGSFQRCFNWMHHNSPFLQILSIKYHQRKKVL